MEENLILRTGYLDNLHSGIEYFNNNLFQGKELFLSRAEYDLYSSIEIEGVKFEDIVEKFGKNISEERYAKLRVKKWLDLSLKDYLQMINIELGFESLPNAYKNMPIYLNSINGSLEEFGNLSDDGVAELVLFNETGIELVNGELTDLDRSLLYRNVEIDPDCNCLMEYFWDIRIASLSILMDREYTIKERLLLLGVFYEHLDLLNDPERVDLVPQKIEDMMRIFKMKTYKKFFKNLPDNEYLYLDILEYFMGLDKSKYSGEQDLIELELSFNGFLPRIDLYDLRSIYNENKRVYDNWSRSENMVLENYLVNEFIREAMPYTNLGSLRELYNEFISNFIAMKTILLGNCVYSGRLSRNLLIDKVSSYSRFKLENPVFIRELSQFMYSKSYYSIECLAIIL